MNDFPKISIIHPSTHLLALTLIQISIRTTALLYICTMSVLDSVKDTLIRLKPELGKRYNVKSIGLFGSVVRDDFSPAQSDIDIIVDFSAPIGIEFVDLAEYLESQINRKVDLVSRNGIKQNYYRAIESEIIYV